MALKHQQIIDELVLRFNRITVANGFYLDLATYDDLQHPQGLQTASDWRASIYDHDEETVNEATAPDVTGNREYHQLSIDVELQKQQINTSAVDTDIRKAIADVRKGLSQSRTTPFPLDRTLNGLAINLLPLGFTIPKSELGEYVVGQAIIKFRIDYRTTIFLES